MGLFFLNSVPALMGTTASSVAFCRLMLIVRAGLFGCFHNPHRNPLNPCMNSRIFNVHINTYSSFFFGFPCLVSHFDVVIVQTQCAISCVVTVTVCHVLRFI